MTDKRLFSDDQLAAYRRDGFIVARGLFDAAAMRDIARWTDEVEGWPETPGKWMKYFDESRKRSRAGLSKVEEPVLIRMIGAPVSRPICPLFSGKEEINYKMWCESCESCIVCVARPTPTYGHPYQTVENRRAKTQDVV